MSCRPFASPAPSNALRLPSLRGRRSHRGAFVGGSIPTRIHYESQLEQQVAVVLLARPDVVSYQEQARHYDVPNVGTHTFDGFLTVRDGRRLLVAVKPFEQARRHDLRGQLDALAAHIPLGDADGIVVLTERDVRRAAVRDAELIHSVRRDQPGSIDETVWDIMSSTIGSLRISEIAARTSDPGGAFRAVVRRIDKGDVVLASRRPITPESRVRKA